MTNPRRRAVVSGGGRGIGRAICIELADAGLDVVVGFNSDQQAAQSLSDELAAKGVRATAIRVDVGDPADVARFIDEAAAWHDGAIDVLCCNAGIEHFGTVDDVDTETYDRIFAVNTRGTFLCVQRALPYLPAAHGRIICTSSMSATTVFPNHVIYSASKAAVEAMVRSLAIDLAARHITVNAIAPGGTMTDLVTDVATNFGSFLDPAYMHMPAGRLAEPFEIAKVAAFLASVDAEWVTGQTIRVAGGQ